MKEEKYQELVDTFTAEKEYVAAVVEAAPVCKVRQELEDYARSIYTEMDAVMRAFERYLRGEVPQEYGSWDSLDADGERAWDSLNEAIDIMARSARLHNLFEESEALENMVDTIDYAVTDCLYNDPVLRGYYYHE